MIVKVTRPQLKKILHNHRVVEVHISTIKNGIFWGGYYVADVSTYGKSLHLDLNKLGLRYVEKEERRQKQLIKESEQRKKEREKALKQQKKQEKLDKRRLAM